MKNRLVNGLYSKIGHRKRLRERFFQSGLDGMLDYEIIELLLTLGTPRKDCKHLAKEVINKFGSLSNVLDAPSVSLQQINGIGLTNTIGIQLVRAVAERYSRQKINPKILLHSPKQIFKYLLEKIGREYKEHFVVLFLDTRNHLVVDTISIGSLNASIVHPREVFSNAILQHSSHVVIAHNHPSGDASPSIEDVQTTKRLVEAGKILGISVIDHVIITKTNFISFRELGLISN